MKQKKPTQSEIKTEIKSLEACKAYAPKTNFFGDNNHHNIDLQIEELSDGFDDTAGEWDELSESEQGAIMEAKNWKEGYERDSPSSGWKEFKK